MRIRLLYSGVGGGVSVRSVPGTISVPGHIYACAGFSPQNGPFSQVRVHMHRLILVLWSTYLDACTFITPLLLLVLLLLTKMKCTVGYLAVPIPHRSQLMLTDDKNEWKLGAHWSHWELLYGARVGWQLLMYHKTTRTENYAYEKWPSYQIKNCSVLAAVCSPQVGFSAGSSLTLPLLSGPEKEIQHFRCLPTNQVGWPDAVKISFNDNHVREFKIFGRKIGTYIFFPLLRV